jgi:hypothetical protein
MDLSLSGRNIFSARNLHGAGQTAGTLDSDDRGTGDANAADVGLPVH